MSKRYTPLDLWLDAILRADNMADSMHLLKRFREEVEREYADEHGYLLLAAFALGIFVCWVFS